MPQPVHSLSSNPPGSGLPAGQREEHKRPRWPGPQALFSHPPSKDQAALTVVIANFRGIQDPVRQGRDVAAGPLAGARRGRGLLAVEDFQSVLVTCPSGGRLDTGTPETSPNLEGPVSTPLPPQPQSWAGKP